ncbi:MAG: hypothetical protein RBR08_15165 [Desulforegulaceae bacterium]|nr:hypothetical protein [Desulforegulaceae bacterium]
MSKLLFFLEKTLRAFSKAKSEKELGNRSLYVGASDLSCPRKAFLSKTVGVEHDTQTLLRFERGHAAEDIVAGLFQYGNLKTLRQVEVSHPQNPMVKAHLDFVFYGQNRVHILECKSGAVPLEPYGDWIEQLQMQMGLFKLNNPHVENLTGSILCVDLQEGEWHEFGSYQLSDLLFKQVEKRAFHIVNCLDGKEVPVCRPGLLCGYCFFEDDCPARPKSLQENMPPEMEALLQSFIDKDEAEKKLKKEKNLIREQLLGFTGKNFFSSFETEEYVTSLKVNTSSDSFVVDNEKLKNKFPEIYNKVLKPKKSSPRLTASRKKKK